MRRKLVFLLALVALPTWRAARAEPADERPPIVLALDPCADVDAQEVRRLMPIEMGAPVTAGEGSPRDTTRVSVGCVVDSPHLVRLEVRDPTTGKILERVITLAGVAKQDRGRLVAISAVELVAASRSGAGRDLEHAAPQPTTVAPQPAPSLTRSEPMILPPPPPPWRLLAVGGLRGVAGLPNLLPGAGLAVSRVAPRTFGVGGDVMVEGAAQPTALTNVDTLLVSVGLAGTARIEQGRAALEVGLGARGGVARLVGQSRADPLASVTGYTFSARWGGPLALLRATLAPSRSFVLSLGGEVGYVTAGVQGRRVNEQGLSEPAVAVSGVWWGATLGVGYAP